ncbi:MAG: hypothetical protein JO202_02285 [Ktedonobacteraceae bacterium]|nr:hypothetical protein [Ktedonobacteraceae bacterium]
MSPQPAKARTTIGSTVKPMARGESRFLAGFLSLGWLLRACTAERSRVETHHTLRGQQDHLVMRWDRMHWHKVDADRPMHHDHRVGHQHHHKQDVGQDHRELSHHFPPF